jgi:demethylmenaquinone methyltransferase/2-methoxy-6-polyprenyl-1,4-benzoquinol methylase
MFDHFDLLAPIYERLILPPDPAELSELLALTPACVLLDAAGGTGRVAGVFASQTARTVVCDASPRMLERARRKGLETVLAEIEALPFADATFDRILLVDAFHHVRDQAAALRELLRVLKPAGRLVIEEPDIRRLPVKIAAALERLCLMRSRFVTPERIIAMIDDCGGRAAIACQGPFRVWLTVTRREGISPLELGAPTAEESADTLNAERSDRPFPFETAFETVFYFRDRDDLC